MEGLNKECRKNNNKIVFSTVCFRFRNQEKMKDAKIHESHNFFNLFKNRQKEEERLLLRNKMINLSLFFILIFKNIFFIRKKTDELNSEDLSELNKLQDSIFVSYPLHQSLLIF